MYQALNKQRQINDMRQRQQEIQEKLGGELSDPKLKAGLLAESQEIARLIPQIENYVTDVNAPAEHQAKEVEAAESKIAANKERTSKLLRTLLKKQSKLITDQAEAQAEKDKLEKEVNRLASDPEAHAQAKAKLATHEAKIARLNQVSDAIKFNQKNAIDIAAGDVQLQVTDPNALASIALCQRKVEDAMDGTIAHDMAIDALRNEQAKAEREFLGEVDAYEEA
ncbi:hypothetical protein [Vibrio coralliilyticus]|uniref:Uncharacterized protein n=1 Tax=Vibrio coralliilyticus TaxID=190893 RepID=A0AAP7DGG1_9VIBR|nr:hypothetical protein [Vibrio coralliilyticus]NOJ26336.1 hypothetical protein [Vibrio coralliilyticus]